ncbi:hypothetical protein ACFFJB_12040 [Camelimonas abortus]|uniref:Uncharacterized protein n=1 Tax=Camelimonas abortus TaxID=1017184 RepID=A0ABV7LD72_9HYPH
MGVIGRAFLVLFALCCAFAVCALMLGVVAVVEPGVGAMAAFAFQTFIDRAFSLALDYDDPRAAFDLLARLWGVMAVLLAGPVTLVGLTGEIARIRSYVWYSGGAGAVTALLPWLARAGYGDGAVAGTWGEGRVTLALFLCGAMAGLAYWTVAGRSAGRQAASAAPPAPPVAPPAASSSASSSPASSMTPPAGGA